MKSLKDLYIAAKNSYEESAAVKAYVNQIDSYLESKPYLYFSNLPYVIESSYGLETFVPFIEKYGIPLQGISTVKHCLAQCKNKCKWSGKDDSSYTEAEKFLEKYIHTYKNSYIMYEAFEEDLDERYIEAYYKNFPKIKNGKVNISPFLERYGNGCIPDLLIYTEADRSILESIYDMELPSTREKRIQNQWIADSLKDFSNIDNDIQDIFTKESLEYKVEEKRKENEQFYRESMMNGELNNQYAYTKENIQNIEDLISYKEYQLLSMLSDDYYTEEFSDAKKDVLNSNKNESVGDIQNYIYSLYEELSPMITEETADSVIPNLPQANRVPKENPPEVPEKEKEEGLVTEGFANIVKKGYNLAKKVVDHIPSELNLSTLARLDQKYLFNDSLNNSDSPYGESASTRRINMKRVTRIEIPDVMKKALDMTRQRTRDCPVVIVPTKDTFIGERLRGAALIHVSKDIANKLRKSPYTKELDDEINRFMFSNKRDGQETGVILLDVNYLEKMINKKYRQDPKAYANIIMHEYGHFRTMKQFDGRSVSSFIAGLRCIHDWTDIIARVLKLKKSQKKYIDSIYYWNLPVEKAANDFSRLDVYPLAKYFTGREKFKELDYINFKVDARNIFSAVGKEEDNFVRNGIKMLRLLTKNGFIENNKEAIYDALVKAHKRYYSESTNFFESLFDSNTNNKKTGGMPDYLKNNHNMSYGEDDDDVSSSEHDTDYKRSPKEEHDKLDDITPYNYVDDEEEPSSDYEDKKASSDNSVSSSPTSSNGSIYNYYYNYNNSNNTTTSHTNTNSFNKHHSIKDDNSSHIRDNHSINKSIDDHSKYKRANLYPNHKEEEVKESFDFSLNLPSYMEEVGDADDMKPESDHPIQDTLHDIDRNITSKQQAAKKTVQSVANTGKLLMRPFTRTAEWVNNMINNWKDKSENAIKEKMADPHQRSSLFSAIKKSIIVGSLYKAGLLLNPVLIFLAIAKKWNDHSKMGRLRNEMIGELKTELAIIDEKIRDADRNGDNKAKYQMMRFKNELSKKLIRVGGTPNMKKII